MGAVYLFLVNQLTAGACCRFASREKTGCEFLPFCLTLHQINVGSRLKTSHAFLNP
jgi:hypothetical protein